MKNYDDVYQWSLETADALRAGDFSRINMDELVVEIESIASGLRRELVSVLQDIVEALLVLKYTNEVNKNEVERQFTHAQVQLQILLDSAPTIKEAIPDVIDLAYQRAKETVVDEYGVSLPDTNPFPLDEITEDPHERLGAGR